MRDCASIKAALIDFLTSQVEVSADQDRCVVTLPLKTLDDRYVDVVVDDRGDFVLVHDGAAAASELYVQGIHFTDKRRKDFQSIADRFGATVDHYGAFQILCRKSEVNEGILRIGQCTSLGMYEVINHFPSIDEEPLALRVRRTLDHWDVPFFRFSHQVHVLGAKKLARHTFDSVAYSQDGSHRTVAMKVLTYSFGPKVQAERYGFLALDIDRTDYADWLRLAVVSKADQWPKAHLSLVKSLSNRTIEIPTGQNQIIDRELKAEISSLAKAG